MAASTPSTAAAEIRARLDEWIRAAEAKDLEAIMACYTPDVRAFDAIGPLHLTGAAAYRQHWEMCLTQMQGPVKFTIHSLDIVAQGDVAFCHYLVNVDCGATGPDGEAQAGWTRATVCLRRTGGTWRIAHEHYSAPFDPESGKARFDLKPDDTASADAA